MTESESSNEILNLSEGLHTTLKSIDSKLNNIAYKVNEVHINESSGDVHIAKKLLIRKLLKKSESESESESELELTKSPLNIETKNVHNLSKDIEDGVHDIFLAMQNHFIDSKISYLVSLVNDRLLSLDEYNYNIEKGIDDILKMPYILKPRIHKLRHILLKKYINKHEIKSTNTFWKDNQVNRPIIDW